MGHPFPPSLQPSMKVTGQGHCYRFRGNWSEVKVMRSKVKVMVTLMEHSGSERPEKSKKSHFTFSETRLKWRSHNGSKVKVMGSKVKVMQSSRSRSNAKVTVKTKGKICQTYCRREERGGGGYFSNFFANPALFSPVLIRREHYIFFWNLT